MFTSIFSGADHAYKNENSTFLRMAVVMLSASKKKKIEILWTSCFTMPFIKYVIPEDGDDFDHPNVFMCGGDKSAEALTLGDVMSDFPVPGKYQFRFMRKTASGQVWFDVTDKNGTIPRNNNEIFAKVSRVGTQHYQAPSSSSPTSSQRPVSNGSNGSNGQHGGPVESAPVSSASVRKPSLDVWDSKPQPQEAAPSSETARGRRNSERLLKFDDDNLSGNTPSKSPIHGASGATVDTNGSGLLDFGSNDSGSNSDVHSAGSASNSNLDLFGLEAGAPVPISPSPQGNIGGQTHNPLGGGGGGQASQGSQGGQSSQGQSQGANGMNPMMGGGGGNTMQGMNNMNHISSMGMGGFQPPMGQQQQRKNNDFNALDAFSSMGNSSNGNGNQNGNKQKW